MKQIETTEQVDEWIEKSKEKNVLFLKHSFRCPISGGAKDEVESFVTNHPDIPVVWIDVVNHREASNYLSEKTEITHQSPQVIFFKKGKAVWHTSHREITLNELEKQIL